MSIRTDLLNLKEDDMWSVVLFVLFKLGDDPQYSSLSELVYLLPKESVLSLFKYYGGMTIKIPTLEELEDVLLAILLYKNTKIDGEDYQSSAKKLSMNACRQHTVKEIYDTLCKVLQEYEFKPRI